jgi:hypothetical protein
LPGPSNFYPTIILRLFIFISNIFLAFILAQQFDFRVIWYFDSTHVPCQMLVWAILSRTKFMPNCFRKIDFSAWFALLKQFFPVKYRTACSIAKIFDFAVSCFINKGKNSSREDVLCWLKETDSILHISWFSLILFWVSHFSEIFRLLILSRKFIFTFTWFYYSESQFAESLCLIFS